MNHFFTHFNEVFDQISNGTVLTPAIKQKTFSVPNYPHSNVWMSKDTNALYMEFALAGYDKDKVSVTAGSNTVIVSAEPKVNDESNEVSIHRGISRRQVNFTMNIDEAFEPKKAKVKFENGMLSVQIPKSKESESIQLF